MKPMQFLAAGAMMAASQAAAVESRAVHRTVDPASIMWGAAPAALEPGARAALLYGDPAKPELFVMRLWLPKGFRVAPHTHPRPEIVTVISGKFLIAMGSDANRAKARRLGPGSFSSMDPGIAHYAFAEEDTVIQISTTGPWAVNYLNSADGPRKKANP